MQLNKGKHSILAYFASSEKAQQAAQEIMRKSLVEDRESIQVDMIHRYPVPRVNASYDNPISEGDTLSGLTLYSSQTGPEGPNPLLAASESASGYGNPHAGAAGGQAYMLTLVTSEQNVSRAVAIIKAHEGTV